MSASTVRGRRRSAGARLGSRATALLRAASGEERVFGAALVVLAIHLLGIALRGGHSTETGLALALAALVGAPALFVLFVARGRVVRTLLAAALGLMAAAAGLAAHVAHALLNGPAAGDYTGIAVALAGIVLIGLAFRTALRGRPHERRPNHRDARRPDGDRGCRLVLLGPPRRGSEGGADLGRGPGGDDPGQGRLHARHRRRRRHAGQAELPPRRSPGRRTITPAIASDTTGMPTRARPQVSLSR